MAKKLQRRPNLTKQQLLYLQNLVRSHGQISIPRGVAASLLKKDLISPYIVWGRGSYFLKYQPTAKAVNLVRRLSA